jgi:hypothetical protein
LEERQRSSIIAKKNGIKLANKSIAKVGRVAIINYSSMWRK